VKAVGLGKASAGSGGRYCQDRWRSKNGRKSRALHGLLFGRERDETTWGSHTDALEGAIPAIGIELTARRVTFLLGVEDLAGVARPLVAGFHEDEKDEEYLRHILYTLRGLAAAG